MRAVTRADCSTAPVAASTAATVTITSPRDLGVTIAAYSTPARGISTGPDTTVASAAVAGRWSIQRPHMPERTGMRTAPGAREMSQPGMSAGVAPSSKLPLETAIGGPWS